MTLSKRDIEKESVPMVEVYRVYAYRLKSAHAHRPDDKDAYIDALQDFLNDLESYVWGEGVTKFKESELPKRLSFTEEIVEPIRRRANE